MTALARLGAFTLVLTASLGVGLAVGAAVGPVDDQQVPARHVEHTPPTAPVTS